MSLSAQPSAWEKVHTAFNEAEFHLITGIMEGEGVEWRVKSSRVPQLPFAHHALGAMEIYVPKLDAPLAKRILMIYRNASGNKPQTGAVPSDIARWAT